MLGQFRVGAAAGDLDDRFIYNTGTGGLFFDPDGSNVAASAVGNVWYPRPQLSRLLGFDSDAEKRSSTALPLNSDSTGVDLCFRERTLCIY